MIDESFILTFLPDGKTAGLTPAVRTSTSVQGLYSQAAANFPPSPNSRKIAGQAGQN
jgi:hypothetical protein